MKGVSCQGVRLWGCWEEGLQGEGSEWGTLSGVWGEVLTWVLPLALQAVAPAPHPSSLPPHSSLGPAVTSMSSSVAAGPPAPRKLMMMWGPRPLLETSVQGSPTDAFPIGRRPARCPLPAAWGCDRVKHRPGSPLGLSGDSHPQPNVWIGGVGRPRCPPSGHSMGSAGPWAWRGLSGGP